MHKDESTNPSFTSKVGLIMAAVGSAVGLGNIWKFPYIAGESGGGAFLIVYLVCVLLFGLPLLMTEFIIGKRSEKSVYGAFRALSRNNRWQWLSWLCLLATIMIMSFYFMVTGWCLSYLADALMNAFSTANDLEAHFAHLSGSFPRMSFFALLAIIFTAFVLWFDVNKGIERLSKILTPLLLLMMIIMAVVVLMLPNSNIGMRFFFDADFSKITPQVILSAMGQCFFSLSIGLGVLITYGSYMPKKQDITATSLQVVLLDTLVAVLAGVIIFPAVFAFGFDPAEGPELVFVVLPAIFEQMSLPWLSSVLFFTLLCIAAITSTISLMEAMVAFLTDATAGRKHPLNRHSAVLITVLILIISSGLCILSVTGVKWLTFGNWNLFDIFDKISSCLLMPLSALAMALFVGWTLPKSAIQQELHTGHKRLSSTIAFVFMQIVRYLVPLAILAIFFNEVYHLIVG